MVNLPKVVGEQIFANVDNVTVYRTTSTSDGFSFLGIDPKKPVFMKDAEIGTFTGVKENSRDMAWYQVNWIHAYKRLSWGGTRFSPIPVWTSYSEIRTGFVKGTDIYSPLVITGPPNTGGNGGNGSNDGNEPKPETDNGNGTPAKETAASSTAEKSNTGTVSLWYWFIGLLIVVAGVLTIKTFSKNQ